MKIESNIKQTNNYELIQLINKTHIWDGGQGRLTKFLNR